MARMLPRATAEVHVDAIHWAYVSLWMIDKTGKTCYKETYYRAIPMMSLGVLLKGVCMNKHTYLSTRRSVVGRIALLALLIVALAACDDPNGGNGNGGDNTNGGNGGGIVNTGCSTDDPFDTNGINENKPVITAGDLGDVGSGRFGNSVAFSDDGNTALIGVQRDGSINSGSAYVFTRIGTTWSDGINLTAEANIQQGDTTDGNFGHSVALSGDGNTAFIGAPRDDNPFDSGAVYVFTWDGTTWTRRARIAPTTPIASSYFGTSVALSGNTALIGAPGGNFGINGWAYAFTGSGATWTQQRIFTTTRGATKW